MGAWSGQQAETEFGYDSLKRLSSATERTLEIPGISRNFLACGPGCWNSLELLGRMLGQADLKTTQIDAQVSIRHLKQIHSATHPAQLPKQDGESKPDEAAGEELLSALAAEEDAEEEEES